MAQSFNDGNRHLGLPSPSNKIFFCRQGSLTGAVGEVLVNATSGEVRRALSNERPYREHLAYADANSNR